MALCICPCVIVHNQGLFFTIFIFLHEAIRESTLVKSSIFAWYITKELEELYW